MWRFGWVTCWLLFVAQVQNTVWWLKGSTPRAVGRLDSLQLPSKYVVFRSWLLFWFVLIEVGTGGAVGRPHSNRGPLPLAKSWRLLFYLCFMFNYLRPVIVRCLISWLSTYQWRVDCQASDRRGGPAPLFSQSAFGVSHACFICG